MRRSPIVFFLLGLAVASAGGCSVERSGRLMVSAADLGPAVDLGGLDGGAVDDDLGSVEVDGGTTTTCVPASCAGRFCAGDLCGYARSCNELKNARGGPTSDGVYTIDGDGDGALAPADAYCDMTSDAGGWTLVLKADGSRATFSYDAAVWTDTTELAGSTNLDAIEAKLRSYVNVGFTQMRIVMVTGAETHALVLDVAAGSCVELFGRGRTVTAVPRDTWLGMVPDVSLQDNCPEQGINVAPASDEARVRIGIVGNDNDNCDSPDSRIGIGGAGGSDITVGNVARWNGWGGDRDTVSFGYVFVR